MSQSGGAVEPAKGLGAEFLGELLERFVQVHSGMRQRDARWHAEMGVTVGGSEIAALMGMNPYSSFYDVLADKVAALSGGSRWTGGGEACWWGTLFEDVIGAYVEVDLGSQIKGDEICIRAIAGHRNSPDGYIVARFYRDEDGGLCLWSTDLDPDMPTVPLILLLEFKCPLTRCPKAVVPKQYQPQVWSGLAVSPIAHKGLYVDSVFRKCSIPDLGDDPEYDTAYHCRDKEARGAPVAWGLIGVYAPYLDAPRHVRLGWRGEAWAPADPDGEGPDADAAQAAWQIHSTYFGFKLKNQRCGHDLVDLGDAESRLFNRTLGLIDRKRFPVLRVAPCFADGRGHNLRDGSGFRDTIAELQRGAPADHWLFALLPWKLFEVAYFPVERRPRFMEEVLPLIDDVHRMAAEAMSSGDPAAFLKSKRAQYAKKTKPVDGKKLVGEEALQDLFDSISKPPS